MEGDVGGGDGGGVSVEKIPMPMDSEEGLQEFAGAVEEVENPTDLNNANAKGTKSSSEGWYKKYCRWIPTSTKLQEEAEKKVLSYVNTKYEGAFVDIGKVEKVSNCKWSFCNKSEERKVWTLTFNKESEATPLVIVHGLCAAAGLWAMNIDALAEHRPLYAIDLLGFGRSSRPTFANDAGLVEAQHVEALEDWRKEVGLEKFVLLGHSMGGFLSTAYALTYPDRVAHLVLADPWGFPKKPNDLKEVIPERLSKSKTFKVIKSVGDKVNPLAVIRAAGPMGPGLINKVRPDLVNKFQALNQNGSASVAKYIYHSNAQKPSGENAFRTMMDFFGWAKHPMCLRLQNLPHTVPLTVIYGGQTWLQRLSEEEVMLLRPAKAHTEVITIPGAGHHLYVDNQSMFNSIVNKAAAIADKLLGK